MMFSWGQDQGDDQSQSFPPVAGAGPSPVTESYTLIRVLLALMFIVELALSWLLLYRQFWHIRTTRDVPPIIKKYDDGIYLKEDLLLSREYTLSKLQIQAFKKGYVIFLWILVSNTIGSLWHSTASFNFIWPQFVGPVVGRNMSFAMFCYVYHELLMIPMHAIQISHRAKYGAWKVVQFFLEYFADLAAALIPVAITAGLVAKVLITLDSSSSYFQSFTLIMVASLTVFLYPLADVWLLLHENEELMSIRQAKGLSRSRSAIVLENRLHRLCGRVGFPKEDVIIVPSTSEQTSAFYFGFLSFRRIFVFQGINDYHPHDDSSPEEGHNGNNKQPAPPPPAAPSSQPPSPLSLTTQEVEAVIAHEIGHWFYGHSSQTLWIWHIWHISTWLLVYLVRSSETISKIFQFWRPGDVGATLLPGAFVTYFIILRIYYALFELLSQAHSHWTEREADAYATVTLGYRNHFAKALIKIVMEQQTTPPSSDPLYQLCYHNHPSLVQRLSHLSSLIKSAPTQTNNRTSTTASSREVAL